MEKSAGGTDMQRAASVGTSVCYHGEPGVLRDHGGLVACTPLALVAFQPVTSVGWRRPNVVVSGHLVRLSRYAR